MEPNRSKPYKSYIMKKSSETDAEYEIRVLREMEVKQKVRLAARARSRAARLQEPRPITRARRAQDLNRDAAQRLRDCKTAQLEAALKNNIELRKQIQEMRIMAEQQNVAISTQAELLSLHLHLVKHCFMCHYRLIGWALQGVRDNPANDGSL